MNREDEFGQHCAIAKISSTILADIVLLSSDSLFYLK